MTFRKFLLDMNQLFEDFIAQSFLRAARPTVFSALSQNWDSFGRQRDQMSASSIRLRPDVVLRSAAGVVVVVVDAKYKRLLDDSYPHTDLYQMLAYGTALRCPRTYLFFPSTEIETDTLIEVNNSSVTIAIRRIDLADAECVWSN